MAKIENTKMTVSLDNDSKRLIRNLAKAIDRLASRKWDETDGSSGVKRLTEPAGDPALSDDNEGHSPGEKPSFARGGYVSANTMPEPDKGCYIPGNRVDLDASTINKLQGLMGFEEGATFDQPGSVDGAYTVPNVHAQNVAAMEALR